MSFQYIPFQFSNLPRVRCAFQMRSAEANSLHSVSAEDISLENSSIESNSGNISFTVNGNFEKVLENRQSMQDELSIRKFAEVKQIHSDILVFDPEMIELTNVPHVEADAMATNRRGFALLIKTADCQSILITHKSGGHIMGLHAGWRGNRMNFPKSAIEKFCDNYQLEPKDLLAVRGPSLGPNRAEFMNFKKDWSEDFRPWYDENTKCMNLWELTKHQLLDVGLLENNVYSLDLCTSTMNDSFFSYRKDKNCGRQASLIWIE